MRALVCVSRSPLQAVFSLSASPSIQSSIDVTVI